MSGFKEELKFGYIVEKRDLSREEYNGERILKALTIAFNNVSYDISEEKINELMNTIETSIYDYFNTYNTTVINIEEIQSIIEDKLMTSGYYSVAKHYITYRFKRTEDRKKETYVSKIHEDINTPWGPLGYVTYKRTYSRRLSDDTNKTEDFKDTILRVLDACQKQLNVGFTNNEIKNAYRYFMGLKCSVAGRFLWQLGTKTVDKLGLMSLQNCAFTNINEPVRPFLWIFDVLMLGTGVGFNIQRYNVDKLPPLQSKPISITRLDTNDADFIVPDSREGWVSLLEKTLEAYFFKGNSFTYSTILIRSKGRKINGFGGLASGPESLVTLIETIQKILNKRLGQKLTSVDCLDLVNIIATCVVAGNVRRCQKSDALVFCKTGLKKIKDIEVGEEVLTSAGYEKVVNKFYQGVQELVKIKTQDGEFECTPNHRMAVYKSLYEVEWKMAMDLKPGDRLMTNRVAIEGSNTSLPELSYEDITVPTLDADLAWLIGIFQVNGTSWPTYEYGSVVSIYCNNSKVSEKIKEQFQRFQSGLYVYIHKFNVDNCFKVYCNNKSLSLYFSEFFKEENMPITIPEYIKMATKEVKLGYIAGIIDGYIINDTNFVSSVYLDWIRELQVLCYSCGFEARLYSNSYYSKMMYGLKIITEYSKTLISSIPQLYSKFKLSSKHTDCNYNSFPLDFIKKEYGNIKFNPSLKQMRTDMYEELFGVLITCPTEVVGLEYNRKIDETYDIEVENMHEFFCDGYLTHNSALIAIGDPDDKEYLKAKNWGQGNIPNWRCMSNNSVNCSSIDELDEEFWNGYNGTSECYGLVNMELCRKTGRLKDFGKYPDPRVEGFNPCCISGDTIILTKEGRLKVKDLIGRRFTVLVNGVGYPSTEDGFWFSGKKDVYELELENGLKIKSTGDHRFMTNDGWRNLMYMTKDTLVELEPKTIDKYSKVKSITKLDDPEDVYDCTIMAVNCFSANGILTHNCEQPLESGEGGGETCCLSEIFLPNIDTFEELISVGTTLYKICKHSLLLDCHHSSTEEIVHKNMRMGIGITGYLQCKQNKKDWLSPLYEYLREFDKDYSAKLGCPQSIKLTTCKPSGTLSILAGVTPGCHPGIYQHFIRRIRIASDNPLIDLCKKHGYKTEYQRNFDGTDDRNTIIVEFPCKYPDGTRLAKDMTAIDQLEVVKELQTNWSDNAVSCSIYYRLNELDSIKEWLRNNYTNNVKSCSFLLHSEHGFDQAPYEEITPELYNELMSKCVPITSGNIEQADDDQLEVCKGGVCPLK